MPLGSNVSANISELVHHGTRKRSRRQIIAIAISAARKAGGKVKKAPKSRTMPRKHYP